MKATLTSALSQYKHISGLKEDLTATKRLDPDNTDLHANLQVKIAVETAQLGKFCHDELKLPMIACKFMETAADLLRATNPNLNDPTMDTVHVLEHEAAELKGEAIARIKGQERIDYFMLPVSVEGQPGLHEAESIVTAFLGYCAENGMDHSKLCLKLQSEHYPENQRVLNFKINGLTVIASPVSKSMKGEFDVLLGLRGLLGENSIELKGVLYNKETMSVVGYAMEYFKSTGDIPEGSFRRKDKSYYNQFLRNPDNAVSLIDRFASAMIKTSESDVNHGDAVPYYLKANKWLFLSNTLIDESISRFVVIDARFKEEEKQDKDARNRKQITMPVKDPATRDKDAARGAIDNIFRLLSDHFYELISGQYDN